MTNREQLIKEIARLQDELANLPARPKEPTTETAYPLIVGFHLDFGDDARRTPYTFAAVKVGDHWWVTGSSGPCRTTWDGLWRWIEDRGGLAAGTRMFVGTEWAPVWEGQ